MFRCQACSKGSKYYERPVMFTVETREKEYPERPNLYGEDKGDPGGFGYEIVKEIRIHLECLPTTPEAETALRDRYLTSLKPKSFLGNSPAVSRRG